jgi:tetratricopeptide (TPR) repeat protein
MSKETGHQNKWIDSVEASIASFDGASLGELREIRRALGHDLEASEKAFLAQLHGKLMRPNKIAVLPFAMGSNQGESIEPLLGIADQISSRLSDIRQLIVCSMPAVLQTASSCPDPISLGRQLGVDFVLEGEVVRRGEGINATARLTSVNGENLWNASYARSVGELPAVENLISNKVVQRLNLKLTKAERDKLSEDHAKNPDAYQKYKLGRFYLNQFPQEPLDKAIEYFMEAKDLDPTFARAYSGLADAFTAKGIYNIAPPTESFKEALEYAEQALAIDSTLAEAHASLAYAYMCYERNWTAAENAFRNALELNPNYALAFQGLAHLLGAMGRFPEALREIDRALKIDPTSPFINAARGFVFYYARRFEEGRKHLLNAVNINRRFDATYYALALVCEQIALDRRQEGDFEGQQAMFQDAEKAAYKAIRYSRNNSQKLAEQARLHALSGEKDKALRGLGQLNELRATEYVSPFHMATVFAALEMPEEALAHLEEAFENHDQWIMLLNVEPRFEVLRQDKRSRAKFADLIRRLAFSPIMKTSLDEA